jgi:hypothetical protein
MSSSTWRASAARRDPGPAPIGRGPRPHGSWGAAIERARASWDGLTGGPTLEAGGRLVYSDTAAAAILATALGLWADMAASLAAGE